MPHPAGKVRGQSLLPLYESLPVAAQSDRALHELLPLFDLLRIGQASERRIARKMLEVIDVTEAERRAAAQGTGQDK